MIKKNRPPRQVVSRDEYYMAKALWVSTRSKDPYTQVGACIVTTANKPLGVGYNGPPAEMRDYDLDWSRPEKNKYIIHAEINAINFSERERMKGGTLYVIRRPCSKCMPQIVAAGIHKIVYLEARWRKYDRGSVTMNDEDWEACQDIARKGHVQLVKFSGNLAWMWDQMYKWKELGIFD